jgi:arginyl-tRNA synthetase
MAGGRYVLVGWGIIECMSIVEQLRGRIHEAFGDLPIDSISVERTNDQVHGDYTTNVAFLLSKELGKAPIEVAEEIAQNFKFQISNFKFLSRVEAVKPGFVNFYLSKEYLLGELQRGKESKRHSKLGGKRIMVEYAHPNTHKEMHIGHMRTLITGEAIARLTEYSGAKVFRANYQGDIGPHVAKALWGIQELMKREDISLDVVRGFTHAEKAHFLGRGYALGSQEYEENKNAIDSINTELYHLLQKSSSETSLASNSTDVFVLYEETRQWSLEYYEDFYKRFYTTFDRLFFESQMVEDGKRIVTENIGRVFKEENGAVTFPGEQYGLHTRVFITQAGNPTYEGKEMANAFAEHAAFPFDLKVHVVGSEQAGYFQVVFKALELLDPEKFSGKQKHISMGMVTFTDRKMSSRTGDILRVDWLLDQIKERVEKLVTDERVPGDERERIVEEIVVGAVKYSVLKVGTGQNVAFDIEKSVSLEGNSGPYIQYTYARTRSVLGKWQMANGKWEVRNYTQYNVNHRLESEELQLLRLLVHFEDVVRVAAEKYSPNMLCDYLFELCQAFNLFYQKAPILKEKDDIRDFRLLLTARVGEAIQKGLDLLGIKAPERM